MTSVTKTNKTTHNFGTLLRTIACILCIITIPNVGWGDYYNSFLRGEDVEWFVCGKKAYICNNNVDVDGVTNIHLDLGWNSPPGGNGATVFYISSKEQKLRTDDGDMGPTGRGLHQVSCFMYAEDDLFKEKQKVEYIWCNNTKVQPDNMADLNENMIKCMVIGGNDWYCINPADTSVLYDGNLNKRDISCRAVVGYHYDSSEQTHVQGHCLYAFCKDGYTPSADKKSCVTNHCMGTDGSTKYNSGTTESGANVCNSTQHPNATMCERTCNGANWGDVKITQCDTGYYLINGKCKKAGCETDSGDKDVDAKIEVSCEPEHKYAKKCEKKCIALSNYDKTSNPDAKSWSDPYIAECIDDATPVMDTEKSNTITMCFLDKPYNDAIAKLKKLLDDIIRKCGNDGEHIPQESESPGPEPHVPSPLT